MKAVLIFDLPGEQEDFNHAVNGLNWALAVWDIDQQLRNWLKYGHDFEDVGDALEKVREFVHQTLEEKNLNLNMIS